MHIHLIACSDPLTAIQKAQVTELTDCLSGLGHEVSLASTLYEPDILGDTLRRKADSLNATLRDPSIDLIADVSGGDLSQLLLPHIDWDAWAQSTATFMGYSDLTVLITSAIARAGRGSILFQLRHLVGDARDLQQARIQAFTHGDPHTLFATQPVAREVIGGNIRSFLKLAGTPYMPSCQDRWLFLEANSGDPHRIVSYLSQLAMLGIFTQIDGLLLGQFTELDKKGDRAILDRAITHFVPHTVQVHTVPAVGHAADSQALWLGPKSASHLSPKDTQTCRSTVEE